MILRIVGFRVITTLAVCASLLTACNSGSSSGGNGGTTAPGNTPQSVNPPTDAPVTPTGLIAEAGDAQVSLSWSASGGASTYVVSRSAASSGPFVQVASTASTSYDDTELANGTAYYYVVAAANSVGASAESASVSATPVAPVIVQAPAVPAGLTTVPGNAQASISWAASSGATNYSLGRATTISGPFVQVASTASTSFVDTGLTNGSTYYYVVSATNSAGASANSAPVSVTPVAPVTVQVPPVPAGLTAVSGNVQVKVSWSASSGATNYSLRRSAASSGPFVQVASTSSTSYVNTGLVNGTTYYYVVSASNSAGASANSTPVSATPVAPPTAQAPAVPTGLTAVAGNAQVTVTWSASSGATGYSVGRSTASGGPFTQVNSTSSTSFVNTGLANGTTYYYVVSATNAVGTSTNSAPVSATPVAPPTAQAPAVPSGLTAAPGNAQVSVSWSATSGATSYSLGRSTASGGPFTQISSTSTTSVVDTVLTNGTTYYYVVSASNAVGTSANSAPVSATPVAPPTAQAPAVPSGLTAAPGNAQVSVSWSATSGATSYSLGRSTASGGPFTQINSTSSTSFVNTGLTNGTTYYYVVSASNSSGSSANSGSVAATPVAPLPPSSTYALPSDRAALWRPGVSYAPTSGSYVPALPPPGWSGGIPARTTLCKTLSPSGSDDTAAINAALAACPANQTVLLTAGKFVISGNGIVINNSYVTLRGAGPGPGMMGKALGTFPSSLLATLLVKSDGKSSPYPVITVGSLPNTNTMWQTAAFATDAVQGANSVTLTGAAPSGLAPGEIVYVNETYDSAITWYNTNLGDQGGNTTGYNGWGEGEYGVPVAQSRPIGQAMEVASISGTTITFSTPFHKTYRIAHSAHLGRVQVTAKTAWVGLESLFLTGGDGGDGGGNIVFGTASYSWAKNIESAGHGPQYGGALVHFLASFRCEIRDSYLHSNLADIPNISPGGGFYNIVLDTYAADNLVENNISWIANKVMVMRGTGGGNVIGYNYMDDGYGNSYPNQGEAGMNADHMATSHHELFEGNYTWGLSTDSRWGNSVYITWYRNWATSQRMSAWSGIPATSTAFGNPLTTYVYSSGGQSSYFEDEYNRMMVKVGSHHWWFSYVGNVFGTPSLPLLTNPRSYYNVPQTAFDYQWAGSSIPASIDQSHVPIWALGVPDGSEAGFPGNGLDSSVLPVTLRDANFDYSTRTVYWHGIGGSSQSQTAPPGASATGGSTLPPSLYLQGEPAFFGSGVWPWVNGSDPANPVPGALPAYTRFNLGIPNTITGG